MFHVLLLLEMFFGEEVKENTQSIAEMFNLEKEEFFQSKETMHGGNWAQHLLRSPRLWLYEKMWEKKSEKSKVKSQLKSNWTYSFVRLKSLHCQGSPESSGFQLGAIIYLSRRHVTVFKGIFGCHDLGVEGRLPVAYNG